MDFLKLAVQLFMSNMGTKGGNLSASTVTNALQGLLGGADGKIDVGDLVSKLSSGGLKEIVGSWLGDGANTNVSAQQILSILGEGPVSDFAKQLGIGKSEASQGLAATLPQVIDKVSSGGNLLEGDALGKVLGGLGGLFGR